MIDVPGLPGPPLKFPNLRPAIDLMVETKHHLDTTPAQQAEVSTRKTKSPPGTDESVTATILPSRSLPLPMPRPGDEVVVARDPSPARRGSLLRRKSGDFSLPVRYKYVVIPGNNSRAILAAFRRRPWWGPARKEGNPATAVVRSGNVQSRRKSGKSRRGSTGSTSGYSHNAFNLWWEMYVSRPVIEGTNLEAKVRQAVNHFEFNAALVSKKGLWQSLREYCKSGGVSTLADVVPKTFYLSGGALQTTGRVTPSTSGDERAGFIEFCLAMGTLSVASSVTPTERAAAAVGGDSLLASGAASCAGPEQTTEPTSPATSTRSSDQESGGTSSSHGEVDPQRGDSAAGETMPSPSSRYERAGLDWDRERIFCSVHNRCPGASGTPTASPGGEEVENGTPLLNGSVSPGSNSPGLAEAPDGRKEERPHDQPENGEGLAKAWEGLARHTDNGVEPGATAGGMPTWVVKPAANSNCGFGIQVCCSLKEVLGVVDDPKNKAGRSGWIVQRYIERPLLVRGRKFDIRLFVLLVADPSTRSWRRRSKSTKTSENIGNSSGRGSVGGEQSAESAGGESAGESPPVGGKRGGTKGDVGPCPLTAWCHRDAYVRTSSVKYTSDPSKAKDRFVHLTNNAVQRRSASYGQDEPGNKLTLSDLQEWLDGSGSKHKGKANGWVEQTLRPSMHALVAISVAAAASAGINKHGRPYAFELLGYDFMVDDDLRVWLIEVNSNPCLEFVCPLLQGVISRVIEDTLSVALDPVFRPPEKYRAPPGGGGDSAGPTGVGFSRVYPVVQ